MYPRTPRLVVELDPEDCRLLVWVISWYLRAYRPRQIPTKTFKRLRDHLMAAMRRDHAENCTSPRD